jgi:hypothetical protein
MRKRLPLGEAIHALAPPLVFSGSIAAVVSLIGNRDLESYEHAFFSLNRGTAMDAVHVLGQPVYTLSVGLGARLPLHGSLGSSPAAAVAAYLPVPLTYWLVITFSMLAAVTLVRRVLEPVCGRLVTWCSAVLLFCSGPVVNYTIYDDWPETAMTYFAFVGCVFAPHALLEAFHEGRSIRDTRPALFSLAALVYALVIGAHVGYVPLLGVTLGLSSVLALCRTDRQWRTRGMVVAALAMASGAAVALETPDILREAALVLSGGGEVKRLVEGPVGGLFASNFVPFGPIVPRMPFTHLLLAMLSLAIGLRSGDARISRLIVGSALISILLGVGAATLSPGESRYSPSATWIFRDPALAFAVLAAGFAAHACRGITGSRFAAGTMFAMLGLAAVQGPLFMAMVMHEGTADRRYDPWIWDRSPAADRVVARGLSPANAPPGERLALWPGVRQEMRDRRTPSTDLVDAGYALVTAWTKQRVTKSVSQPEDYLFYSEVVLQPRLLCDGITVSFLRLRYLLAPPETDCAPWQREPTLVVDGSLSVLTSKDRNTAVWAVPTSELSSSFVARPAFSPESDVLSRLIALPRTSLQLTGHDATLRLEDPSAARSQALVLPISYDPAWRASSGETRDIGGLLALTNIDRGEVTLDYVPDVVAILRAAGMTLAQVMTVLGFVGASAFPPRSDDRRLVTRV